MFGYPRCDVYSMAFTLQAVVQNFEKVVNVHQQQIWGREKGNKFLSCQTNRVINELNASFLNGFKL